MISVVPVIPYLLRSMVAILYDLFSQWISPPGARGRRRRIGVRIPSNAGARSIVAALGAPLLTASAREDDEQEYLIDPELIHERYGRDVELVIDGGMGDTMPTTVVDLTGDEPEVLRDGKGELQ